MRPLLNSLTFVAKSIVNCNLKIGSFVSKDSTKVFERLPSLSGSLFCSHCAVQNLVIIQKLALCSYIQFSVFHSVVNSFFVSFLQRVRNRLKGAGK